jgi:hypothetical protein
MRDHIKHQTGVSEARLAKRKLAHISEDLRNLGRSKRSKREAAWRADGQQSEVNAMVGKLLKTRLGQRFDAWTICILEKLNRDPFRYRVRNSLYGCTLVLITGEELWKVIRAVTLPSALETARPQQGFDVCAAWTGVIAANNSTTGIKRMK